MSVPNPQSGLVISYAYLWHHEHQGGQEEGRKDRPCVIALATAMKAWTARRDVIRASIVEATQHD